MVFAGHALMWCWRCLFEIRFSVGIGLILVVDELNELAKQRYVAPHFFAGIYVGLGEHDRALEYLEKSYAEHCQWLIYLHIDPSMDDLRNDPRFRDLLRRVDLPAASDAIST